MQLYFRHGEKNVVVFRMEVANRQRRIELNRIARIALDGTITEQANRQPTPDELTRIERWWADHQARTEADALDRTEKFITELGLFTDWLARRADAAEVDARSDDLLTALLDLRQTVVRRLSQVEPDAD